MTPARPQDCGWHPRRTGREVWEREAPSGSAGKGELTFKTLTLKTCFQNILKILKTNKQTGKKKKKQAGLDGLLALLW